MAGISRLKYSVIFLFFSACATDDRADVVLNQEVVLSQFISSKTVEKDAVIACAASSEARANTVNVYFYPEEGARNFKLFETDVTETNPQNFAEYHSVDLDTKPLFNGALRFFETQSNAAWFTVVYTLDETVKIATPIKNKKHKQPSVWTHTLTINQEEKGMPLFSWDTLSEENNAIFFEVLATENLDFISGTYTYSNSFQYYKLDQVVLNITQNTPPALVSKNNYIFTVMDVSLDNWVNQVIMTPFTAD